MTIAILRLSGERLGFLFLITVCNKSMSMLYLEKDSNSPKLLLMDRKANLYEIEVMFMRKKRTPLTKIVTILLCLSILVQAEGVLPAVAAQDNVPTVIYQDSFDYTCWDNSFFAADGVWSREIPQLGNNANFTSLSPRVEDGVMKLSEGMSAQFNWTRISEQFAFDSSHTYTLTFDIAVKNFGDDQPLEYYQHWKRELYFR